MFKSCGLKRQHLARFFTSLVSVTLEAERKRGDVEFVFRPSVNAIKYHAKYENLENF